VRAEAAAWVASFTTSNDSPHLEARVHAWLGESEDHRHAFNRMTHVWERRLIQMRAQGDVSTTRTELARESHREPSRFGRDPGRGGIVAVYFWRDDALVTGVGQQQVRLLPGWHACRAQHDTR